MDAVNQKRSFLKDLKSLILFKKGYCNFFKKAITNVTSSECVYMIKEMIKQELKQIRKLEEKHYSISGKRQINYDPKKHGGIALPQKKDINNLIALTIAIEDKRNSLKMYDELIKKHDTEDSGKLFYDLLVCDRKLLKKWERWYKDINKDVNGKKTRDDTVYRFTKRDVEIITKSLENERYAYLFFSLVSKGVKHADVVVAFRHISFEEKRHKKIFEMIYNKLTDENIPAENDKLLVSVPQVKFNNAFEALDMAIADDKNSIAMYFKFVDECTNTWLRDILWEIIDDEWSHLLMWRRTYKRLKEE